MKGETPTTSDVEDQNPKWEADDLFFMHDDGMIDAEIARALDISSYTVRRYLRWREEGREIVSHAEMRSRKEKRL